MKFSKVLYYSFFILLAVGFFTACEPDPVDIENPTVFLSSEAGYIYQDTSLQKNEVFTVKVTATPGTNDLKLIAVNENDAKLSLDRIISGLNANPSLTLDTDAQGFTKEIQIQAQEEGNSKYTIYVEDTDGYTDGVEFFISDVFTGLDGEVGDLQVFNFSGPNFGSIDLHEPAVVSSSDPNGDIQDEGIDTDLPIATNWLQQIKPKNGAELYLPAEGLTYDFVDSKEKLKEAVEAGTEVLRSQALNIGDIYLAKTPSLTGETMDYFLLRVDNIIITDNNNEDYYIFTLKQALNM